MKKLFLTGWLKHVPLVEIITGEHLEPSDLVAATVPGRLVSGGDGQSVGLRPPSLIADAEARVEGTLYVPKTKAALDRLAYYLDAVAKREIVVEVGDASESALLFGANRIEGENCLPWSEAQWSDQFAPIEVHAAREAMTYYGRLTAEELARLRPSLLARAASTVRAEAGQVVAGGYTRGDVELLARRYSYVGFYAFQEFDLRHRQFNGAAGPAITRGVLVGVEAVIVLPYDPVRDRVLLVEQFRPGPYARGDAEPWLLEPVAGMIDAGESPEETAFREAEEEAGVTITKLIPLAEAYPSPGNSSEFYYFYIGLCDIPEGSAGLGGVATEAEDIKRHILEAKELFRQADAGALRNAPLLFSALALRQHRAALQSGA